MIIRRCDICGEEIPAGEVSNQATVIYKTWEHHSGDQRMVHLEIHLTRAVDGKWNSAEVCASCLRTALADGDYKPKA